MLLAVLLSGKYFAGTIRCGIAPILTPIAMILCMITVSGRRKFLRAERKAQKEAEGLIWEAGELPDMSDRSSQLRPIKGLTPDPTKIYEGCTFAERCPYASEECLKRRPLLKEMGENHKVACLAYEREGFSIERSRKQ